MGQLGAKILINRSVGTLVRALVTARLDYCGGVKSDLLVACFNRSVWPVCALCGPSWCGGSSRRAGACVQPHRCDAARELALAHLAACSAAGGVQIVRRRPRVPARGGSAVPVGAV